MSRKQWIPPWLGAGLLGLAAFAGLALTLMVPLPSESCVDAQPPSQDELPDGLRFVPTDAAVFVYADVGTIWNHAIIESIRKSDSKTFEDLTARAKSEFGLTPDDVKTVVVFAPKLRDPADTEKLGIVLTFRNAYDKDKIAKGAEKLLPKNAKIKVVSVSDRMAIVLLNLGDEYAKPQPAGKTGPLSDALKQAATGNHAAFGGATLASLPEEIRGDDLPAQVRPFQPLFKAVTITAALDLGKTIDLDVRVKTGTAGQAVDCEKSLGALLALIQNSLGEGIKELEMDALKGMGLKDLVALMKAGAVATKGAKFSTLGSETRMTVSFPTDLPFASAYLAAKKKLQESALRAISVNNLKQIALAMHGYHDTHGNCPPAAVCDKTGKPLLSWRVLILPFIEEQKLFMEFKLDQAWDSDHNKKLLARMPKVYAIPGKTNPGGTDTHYRVFVGNGAGFDWVMGTKLTDIADGTSQTLMCVTAAEAVPWTKPEELEFNPEKDMTKLLGAVVNGKVQAAYFDGSVRTFGKIPDKKTLNALITRDGGEVIDDLP